MKSNQKIGWVKFWTPKDDWYYLREPEREKYLTLFNQAVRNAMDKGGNLIGVYKCRGQSEWMRFEIWEFPSVNIIIDFTQELESIRHYQYFAEDNTVGRKYQRVGSNYSWII